MKLTTCLTALTFCLSVCSGSRGMFSRKSEKSDECSSFAPRSRPNGLFFNNGKWAYPVLSKVQATREARKRRQDSKFVLNSLRDPLKAEDLKLPDAAAEPLSKDNLYREAGSPFGFMAN